MNPASDGRPARSVQTEDPDVQPFIELVSEADGHAALSEAKISVLDDPDSSVVVRDGEAIVAVGVIATHRQEEGRIHHAIETVVTPGMRFRAFESTVLQLTRNALPARSPHSVWSSRSSLDEALTELSYVPVRSLVLMEVPLPVEGVRSDRSRRLEPGENEAFVALNNTAFEGHREAGALSVDEFLDRIREPGFSRDGVRVIEEAGDLAAFCWTKMHSEDRGEIYRIGVSPHYQGQGLGREILIEGFGHLSGARNATTGLLWVDEANRAAMELYTSVGMSTIRRNREFEPT